MSGTSYDESAARALDLVAGIVERHGARLCGTEGSRGAATELRRELGASLLLGPAAGSALPAYAGFLAMLLGAAFCVSLFVLYLGAFDFLFPKVEGRNLLGLAATGLVAISAAVPLEGRALPGWIAWALAAGLFLVAPMYGYVSEGARPVSTRLLFALTDGEEAGQEGAKRLVAEHPELRGGTDAAQFALNGIEAASIVGMPTKAIRCEILIHTLRDTPDRIRADAVVAVLGTIAEYLRRGDGRA